MFLCRDCVNVQTCADTQQICDLFDRGEPVDEPTTVAETPFGELWQSIWALERQVTRVEKRQNDILSAIVRAANDG